MGSSRWSGGNEGCFLFRCIISWAKATFLIKELFDRLLRSPVGDYLRWRIFCRIATPVLQSKNFGCCCDPELISFTVISVLLKEGLKLGVHVFVLKGWGARIHGDAKNRELQKSGRGRALSCWSQKLHS